MDFISQLIAALINPIEGGFFRKTGYLKLVIFGGFVGVLISAIINTCGFFFMRGSGRDLLSYYASFNGIFSILVFPLGGGVFFPVIKWFSLQCQEQSGWSGRYKK